MLQLNRIWAISDLHAEASANWEWLEQLPPLFTDDGLIVAGDVCTSLELLRDTFSLLNRKFKQASAALAASSAARGTVC